MVERISWNALKTAVPSASYSFAGMVSLPGLLLQFIMAAFHLPYSTPDLILMGKGQGAPMMASGVLAVNCLVDSGRSA